MLTKALVALFFTCALLLVGCTTTSTTTSNATPTPSGTKTTTPATNPAPTASTPAPVAITGDKIGVPECDDFLAKYEACVSGKVPEAQRAIFTSTMSSWRTAWHTAASTPQGKAALATQCKSALEQSKSSMSAFNCAF